MENASKALLIAGAILLVIAIIAIAVGIVSKTRGTMNVAQNQIDTMEVRMHNNQFSIYEGKVTGEDVKECISQALSNNTKTNKTDMKVVVKVFIQEPYFLEVDDDDLWSLDGYSYSSIESDAIFTGLTQTSSNGIINYIEFKKQ